MSALSSATVSDYLASMPEGYKTAFRARQLEEHARFVLSRGPAVVRVGAFRTRDPLGGALLCIVADDRPGLLAIFSAGLAMSELDVSRAVAYTRTRQDGRAEAVDLFWVRPITVSPTTAAGAAPDTALPIDGMLEPLEARLQGLLNGTVDLAALASGQLQAVSTERATRVRFVEGKHGGLAVLEVETVDRAGLLFCLAQALYAEKVNIAKADVSTEGGRVLDRFAVTEADGQPIGAGRRLDIQVAVLAAIQPTQRCIPPNEADSRTTSEDGGADGRADRLKGSFRAESAA